MSFFKRRQRKRVCVIGLDGVPYSMLQNLAQQGIMPAFQELIESGALHKMKASLPEISSVSWTDFMTGTNAGTHGIFGFTDLKQGTYDLCFPNFLDVKQQTFWDKLGHQNKRSIIINQPSTYPARKINGVLISGFVALELAKSVFPLFYKTLLERMNYQIDIDTLQSRENHEFLWKEVAKTLEGRERALDSLWSEDWDYFEFVITGTDRVQHFLWTAYEDQNHVYHQRLLDYYHQVDRVVGKIIRLYRDLMGHDEGLYLLSDHGFTGIKQEIYLNVWLEKEGYLSFNRDDPKDLNDIRPKSRAFAMDPNRIYFNRKGKYPLGCVDESEQKDLKDEIREKLKQLEFQGESVFQAVIDTEEIYFGSLVTKGPDLIALSHPGFDVKGSVKKKEAFGRSNLEGMHTWDDAFFWSSKGYTQDLHISNLAQIIMERFE